MKIKGSKLKFYLKILNLFLIINMIIGCFPRSLTIADAVINSDVANTRKASDTNADYLASATFYNYYSNYNLNSNYNNSINHNDEYYDKQHYSFETFNRKISDYDKEKLQERLAKMAGGVAVLYVGAPSEVEMKEKKDRVDDALHATRAAIEEGTVPGGGVAYIRAIDALEGMKGDNEDETTGIEIVKRAIEEPLRQIVANAGKEGAVIVQKVKEGKGDFGYNARKDCFENLCEAGVIDPAKVTRVALENAASIAGMFLTTECVIAEKKEETPAMPPMNPGMGGGMGGMM